MTAAPPEIIFHVCRRDEWERAQASGAHAGSSQDAADGFIHFSTAGEVRAMLDRDARKPVARRAVAA